MKQRHSRGAGRSVAGRSVAGRSVAGRSVAGRSVMGGVGAWAAIAAAPVATWLLGLATWDYVQAAGGLAGGLTGGGADGGAWTADQAIVVIVGAVGTGAAAYLCVTALALIAQHARPSRSLAAKVALAAPGAWQRVVAVAMGVALGSGIAVPAVAAADAPDEDSLSSAGWVAVTTVDPVAADPVAVDPVAVDPAAPEQATGQAPATQPLAEFVELATPEPVRIKDTGTATASAPPAAQPAPTSESALAVSRSADALVGAPPAAEPELAAEPAPASAVYTVVRGDSLWRITAALIGGNPSDAAIAAAWPVLYDANRDVIGTNPSLIHPGQVLAIPEGLRA